METLQLVLDMYLTFRAEWATEWLCLVWKIIMGELILMNLCRPALGVQVFLRHSVVQQTYVECCRMQNDVKLPLEQRRKSVHVFIGYSFVYIIV